MSAAARCVVALALLPGIAGFVFENGFLPSYVPAPVEPAVRNQTHNPSPLYLPSSSPTASPLGLCHNLVGSFRPRRFSWGPRSPPCQ
jgi:hypothetical protein